ncbi:MAG: excinuclease ABC subunit A, partial [Planctomycetales bacterium]
PSAGLHPLDVERIVHALRRLRDADNTVVVVDHEEGVLRGADRIVELGPGAAESGGRIVFQGTPDAMLASEESLTGSYLSGRRAFSSPARRPLDWGWIEIRGARGSNLRDVDARIPLGVLCAIAGVSGSGKSALVERTIYPALRAALNRQAPAAEPFDDFRCEGSLTDCLLVDQSPVGKSPRSNPATYIKAFDAVRDVFADVSDAKARNYGKGHFSFNSEAGRCGKCRGDGRLQIDMQFLPDVFVRCPECRGSRYRREILEILHRGRNIAEVLEMTVREAFGFFRGRSRLQAKLKCLMDVGLDYVRLGQPANTLSGGESQRLRLAECLASPRRGPTLFVLDQPTNGLHFRDLNSLWDCFNALLSVGHSIWVIESRLHFLRMADYVIELGPGAAEAGGRVIAEGTPEQIVVSRNSLVGPLLEKQLQ